MSATLARASAAEVARAAFLTQSVVDGAVQMDVLAAGMDEVHPRGGNSAVAPGLLASVSRLMAEPNAAVAARTLQGLSGQLHGSAQAVALWQAQAGQRLTRQRMAEFAGAHGTSAWVQANAGDAHLRREGYAGMDVRRQGIALGMERGLGDAGVVGVALGRGRMQADLAGGADRLESDDSRLEVYARQPIAGGYVSASLGHVWLDQRTRRVLEQGGVTEVLSASHADRLWQARVEAGREFASGLAPFVALAVDGMRQGGFDEHSASGLGLRAPAHVRHVQRAEAGLAFRHRSDVFDLGAELSWQRLLSGAGTGFAAAFDGAPDTGLWVRGQPLPRDQAGLSLRALYRVRSRVGLYADVVAAAASGQVSQVTLDVGMRAGF